MFGLGDQGEPSSNKKTDVGANKTSDTFFPTVKAVFEWVSGLFVKGAASSTDNAIARFDGTTGKIVQNSGVTIDDSGSAIFNSTGDLGLRVTGGGSSIKTWKGRIVAGGGTTVFLMGEYNNQAWLGAHNAALSAWNDFYINPDGPSKCYIGGFGGVALVTFDNAIGKVGIKTTSPTEALDVNGKSRFRDSVAFNGQIIDNVGSSGTDGQIIKKVGGLVLWSNP